MGAEEKPLEKGCFEPHLGSTFQITGVRAHESLDFDVPIEFELEDIKELKSFAVEGADGKMTGRVKPFSLSFKGPKEDVLPQAIFAVSHPVLGELQIFLKPYFETESALYYEALFN